MTNKIIVCRGLPASGKSYFARQHCANTPNTYRVSSDDFRAMLGFPNGSDLWSHDKEAVMFDLMTSSIVQLVKAGHDVVVDATHIRKEWLVKYRKAVRFLDVQFQVADFTAVPLGVCLERNAKREPSELVPEEVIRKMAKTLKGQAKPVTGEWLNEGVGLPVVEPYVRNWHKPTAILVDLDGTLYEHVARTPHQYDLVKTDKVIESTLAVMQWAADAGLVILLASGRPDYCRVDTLHCLYRDGVPFSEDKFWMRRTGDTRADLYVKLDIFNEHIRNDYDILFCLDDRDQVVKLYRDMLGLTTWQVNNGNF